MKGLPVNDNASLEREADVMGARASSGASASGTRAISVAPASNSTSRPTDSVYQRQPWKQLPWKQLLKYGLGGYSAFVGKNLHQQQRIKKHPEEYQDEKGR